MHRNLDRRVETLVSLQGPDQIAHVGEILDKAFDPGTSAWDLEPDGQWIHNKAPDGRLEDFQAYMIRRKHHAEDDSDGRPPGQARRSDTAPTPVWRNCRTTRPMRSPGSGTLSRVSPPVDVVTIDHAEVLEPPQVDRN